MRVCENRLTCITKKRGGLVRGGYQGCDRHFYHLTGSDDERVTNYTHSRVVGLTLEGNLVLILLLQNFLASLLCPPYFFLREAVYSQ